jgi:hypothetical protein
MDLLRAEDARIDERATVFAHGVSGPIAMLALCCAPFVFAACVWPEIAASASRIAWTWWLVIAPAGFVVGGLWLVCLQSLWAIVRASFRSSNWLLAVAPDAVFLQVRSYQNAHFPPGEPTVARIPLSEIATVRRVREDSSREESSRRVSWLEIELASTGCARADTARLERLCAAERERQAPVKRGRFLSSRWKSNHVPVFVANEGCVRVEWLGERMLRELGRHVTVGEARRVNLDASTTDITARLRLLCERGDRIAACELARRELHISLTAARAVVESATRKAA